MNKRFTQVAVVLTLILIGFSCSRKKDKWINRNWHSMTTKNNTLYNGKLAFAQGKGDIVQTYKDNFWEVLPVERLIVSEDVRLPNEVLNENFDKAETKAAKAIQKHSMLIDDRERNPKIDESFLLLGKARYNEQRFIPALEAFNYILYKYPASNNINHAKVWRAKTNVRLDNNEKAIKDLVRMINTEYLDAQDYADALSMISQAYINLKLKDSAVSFISKAAIHTKNNEEKGRYYYIKGQLLNDLGYKDSANYAFDQVIALNRKTPRRYMINAYMAKARNFDYESGNKEEFLELLTDLEENRENRPFLDIIYHQKAEYFKALDSIDLAVEYYNKSLRKDSEDKILESLNYKTLGDFNFDAKEYAIAGAYYDSTLERMSVNSKKYRTLKKKRVNLDDVILYEGIAQKNDSILTVAAMSPDERLAYYKKYTDSLKTVAKELAEAAEIQRIKEGLPAQQRFNQPGTSIGGTPRGGPQAEGGTFYFYNPTTVGFGKTAFKRIYGNRELQDNWRIASVSDPDIAALESSEEVEEYSIEKDPVFDPQTYMTEIPTDRKILDSLQTERNFAYYQLGVIYKEKFQEYGLAIDKFEDLLKSNPEERLVVPTKYNLYKIYQLQGENAKADALKQNIVNNHSETSYAKVLLNPNSAVEDKDSPEAIYNRIYLDFRNQKYARVIKEANAYIEKSAGEDFVPKFELLKAQALGRYEGFEAYKKALNYVALNFPQSPEGKKAQLLYQTAIPQMENNMFEKGLENENNHKLIYSFASINRKQAIELKELIEAILKELKYDRMKVSLDFYQEDQLLVVVHTKRDKSGAEGLGELISIGKTEDTREADLTKWNRRKKYYPAVNTPFFVISSPNYRIVQIHKNLDTYLEPKPDIESEIEPEPEEEPEQ